MRKSLLVVLMVMCVGTLGVVNATVYSLNIKPEHPVKGEVVTLYGKATPGEEVRVAITFEKVVPVNNGEYVFSLNGVKIPSGKHVFSVTAYGCKDLKVSVKLLGLFWVTLGSEAKDGVAVVSQSHVPSGTYDIVIHGESNKSSVRLKVEAVGYITADSNGNYKYSYDTSSLPLGKFTISAGGISKVVELAAHQTTQPVYGGAGAGSAGSAGAGGASGVSTPSVNISVNKTKNLNATNETNKTKNETKMNIKGNKTFNFSMNMSMNTNMSINMNTSVSTNISKNVSRNVSKTSKTGNVSRSKTNKNRTPGISCVLALAVMLSLVLRRFKH